MKKSKATLLVQKFMLATMVLGACVIVLLVVAIVASSKASKNGILVERLTAEKEAAMAQYEAAKDENVALKKSVADLNEQVENDSVSIAELQNKVAEYESMQISSDDEAEIAEEPESEIKEASEDEAKKAEEEAKKKADEEAKKKAEEEAKKAEEEAAAKAAEDAKKKAAEDAAKQQEAAAAQEAAPAAPAPAAPAPVAGGHSYTDKTGASTVFTNDEWNYLLSVWAYTGEAEEMVSHHTIGELRTVLAAR